MKKMNYKIIYEKKDLIKTVIAAAKTGLFSFDIETAAHDEYLEYPKAALSPHLSYISTLSFSFINDDGTYNNNVVPLAHKVGKNINASTEEVMDIIKELIFTNENVLAIAYNAAFECTFMTKHNCYIKNIADPMVMAIRAKQVLEPETLNKFSVLKGMGLKVQAFKAFGYEMGKFCEFSAKSFAHLNIEDGAKYSAEDSEYSLKLFCHWRDYLVKIAIPELCNGQDIGERPYKNYWDFLLNVEMPSLRAIGMMQYNGLGYNHEKAEERAKVAELQRKIAQEKIVNMGKKYSLTVDPGKTGKTKAVRNLLFNVLKAPKAAISEKTGAPSLDTEAVADIIHMVENNLCNSKEVYLSDTFKKTANELRPKKANAEDIVALLENIQIIQKNGTLISSHITGRIKFINNASKRIHSKYGIYTSTSRFNSSEPNAQNIPAARNDKLKVRSLYEPAKDSILLLVDYAAQEVRISAELYKDKVMTDIIKHGWDMHSFTAKEMFNLDIDLTDGSKVEKIYRNPAKPAFFTVTYGGGASALQKNYKDEKLYKSYNFCKDVVAAVKSAYPGMDIFAEKTIAFAEKSGFVETALGYRRLLPGINSKDNFQKYEAQRRAVNTPVQGTAADVTKMALNRLYDKYVSGEFTPEAIKVCATVHDEIIFEISKTNIEKIDFFVKEIKECMEGPIYGGQKIMHLAEPEVADPHNIFGLKSDNKIVKEHELELCNGWADKYDYYKWSAAVKGLKK